MDDFEKDLRDEFPEEYATQQGSLESAMRYSLARFLQGNQTDIQAVNLIDDYIKLNLAIPVELLPFVSQAVSAWRNVKGKANTRKNKTGCWDNLIWHVHLYWLMGSSKKHALALVVKRFPEVYEGQITTYETLENRYDRSSSKAIKDDAELIYGSGFGLE